jgi:methionine biosynthesis protein MetW
MLKDNRYQTDKDIRIDLKLICDMVRSNSHVLDVGCGNGDLLDYLSKTKSVDGRGIELSQSGVHICVSRGLSVVQGDADADLDGYPENAFDYVILSQTLPATRAPRVVLENLVRIGKQAIVSFPNFGYWQVRKALLFFGQMPVTSCLAHKWYETSNIHLCTIRDFANLCCEIDISIERVLVLRADGRVIPMTIGKWANWIGEQAVFLLQRRET